MKKIYYRTYSNNGGGYGNAYITYDDNTHKWTFDGARRCSADTLQELTKGFFKMTEREIKDLFNGEVLERSDDNFTEFLSIKNFDDEDFVFNTVDECRAYANLELPLYLDLVYNPNAEFRYTVEKSHYRNVVIGFADSIKEAKELIDKAKVLAEKGEIKNDNEVFFIGNYHM